MSREEGLRKCEEEWLEKAITMFPDHENPFMREHIKSCVKLIMKIAFDEGCDMVINTLGPSIKTISELHDRLPPPFPKWNEFKP